METKHLERGLSGKYVIAVSGGVDSVVLLDMLSNNSEAELVVAHFDHGMREDSASDAEFVRQLTEKYNLPYETKRVELGQGASEAEAREARYEFLRSVQKKYNAIAIITAHHQDDLLETSMINLLRGTGRRGLHSLKSKDSLLRPLLHIKKTDIHAYAKEHGLRWREDSTNEDTTYLRNKLRHDIIPKADEKWRREMLHHIARAGEINDKLDREIDSLLAYKLSRGHAALSRQWFIMLPHAVASEVVVALLRRLKTKNIDHELVERLTIGMKTARPGKKLDIDKYHFMMITKRSARIMDRQTGKSARV